MEVRLHPLEFARRRLPFVCASTGEQGAWYQRVGVRRPMHPAALLLIFIGPLGWLILVAMAFRPEGTYVEIPISQAVYEQIQERRRRYRWLLAAMVTSFVLLAFIGNSLISPISLLALALTVAAGVWAASTRNPKFRVTIDGVGLVTISRCHPNFVTAIEKWRLTDSGATTRL